MTDFKPDRLIVLGVITSAHGIRGQVKIKSFTEQPEALAAFKCLSDRNARPYQITIHSRTNDMLIASIKGIDNRNDAERLRNTELCVPRSALPKLADGDYYHEDLVGLTVKTLSGENFGTAKALENFGAGNLLLVQLEAGGEDYFPFNRTVFPTIAVEDGFMLIDPPVMEAGE